MYTLVSFATYWGSKYGGINAFNADFLSALGSTYQDVQVICIVSSAQDSDIKDAEKTYVRLIKLPYLPQDKIFGQAQAQTAIDALQEQNITFEPENTVWLGHDRMSGEAAIAAAKLKGGRSALIHHMSYEAYEAFAETSQSALTKINTQRKLFKQADLLLAVGPLLHGALADMVDKNRQDIHCVIPGLATIEPRKNPPNKFRAFLSGRLSDDAKKIKQGHLGIAGFAHALKLAEQHQIPHALLKEPLMLIRGVDFESVQNYGTDAETTIEDEWQMFAEDYAGKRVNLFTLPYTQNRAELYDELKAASVALMPSWHEGFGLVAWEAIAAEVPLILSKNSGVYHLLEQETCENLAHPVQVNGRTKAPYFDDKSLDNVANALKIIASSHANAKSKASDLRQRLSVYTWPACAKDVVSFFNWSFSITNRTNTLSTSITQVQQITLPITGKPVVDHAQASEDDFPIHAYLSYRHQYPSIKARDTLQTLCAQRQINLLYDEGELKEGDHLIKFMQDLSAARCVFLFICPEYFQSAYTLFELICLHENRYLDQRFILPLRVTNAMVTYEWTNAKKYFDNHEAVRNELTRLLTKYHFTTDNLWQRIEVAWETIIFPHLDRLNTSLENADAEAKLLQLLQELRQTIKAVISETTNALQSTLIKNIVAILCRKNINADEQFRDQLSLSSNSDLDKIAGELIRNTEVGEAIAILTRVIEEKKALLGANEWKACFYDAEQLCGWLLLNSVDPTWWFHNEKQIENTAKMGISGSIALHDKNYIEVVISRCLEKAARYALDTNKQSKPAGNKNDVMCFDAFNSEAKAEELLTRIYKDLYGVKPSKDVDILKSVIKRAKTNFKNQNKPVYYLVTSDYFAIWESVAIDKPDVNKLAGYLQFICYDKPAKPSERQACVEDQTQLLDQVAYFLSLQP